ncbi:MAG: hypothetical protein AAGB22_05885 [Bacteroidota bacterium]
MSESLTQRWREAVKRLEAQFGEGMDMEAILFLIGIRELGVVPGRLNKDQKLDVMHIAVCKLLSEYGYYNLVGQDDDGWPHWERTQKLPSLKPMEQDRLMREAIVDYLDKL